MAVVGKGMKEAIITETAIIMTVFLCIESGHFLQGSASLTVQALVVIHLRQ